MLASIDRSLNTEPMDSNKLRFFFLIITITFHFQSYLMKDTNIYLLNANIPKNIF